jgi:hypothetical protein
LTAQVTNSKEEDAKRLNKRFQWQLDHSIRELNFVRLNINFLKLMILSTHFLQMWIYIRRLSMLFVWLMTLKQTSFIDSSQSAKEWLEAY